MANIYVIDHDGVEHEVEATDGWQIMEIIREADLPIKADCGGCCSCATCHVYVDEAWVSKVPPQQEEEEDTLDASSLLVRDNSRLCCQIEFTPELDGLKVTLSEDTKL